MKRSTDRVLTTHTGSPPHTTKVIELLLAEQQARGAHKAELSAAVSEAIAYVVQKQIESASMSSTTANRAVPTIPCTRSTCAMASGAGNPR